MGPVADPTGGYGVANLELQTPAGAQTVYEIGSISKQFTASAVMLLVQEGRVALDDSITKYFPEAHPGWKPVTLRQLLNHTSGAADVWDDSSGEPKSTARIDLRKDYTEYELAPDLARELHTHLAVGVAYGVVEQIVECLPEAPAVHESRHRSRGRKQQDTRLAGARPGRGHGLRHQLADVRRRALDVQRQGVGAPEHEEAKTIAGSPTASITASSWRDSSSSVGGGSSSRDDSPEPIRSNRITRWVRASTRKKARRRGSAHSSSRWLTQRGPNTIGRPSPSVE